MQTKKILKIGLSILLSVVLCNIVFIGYTFNKQRKFAKTLYSLSDRDLISLYRKMHLLNESLVACIIYNTDKCESVLSEAQSRKKDDFDEYMNFIKPQDGLLKKVLRCQRVNIKCNERLYIRKDKLPLQIIDERRLIQSMLNTINLREKTGIQPILLTHEQRKIAVADFTKAINNLPNDFFDFDCELNNFSRITAYLFMNELLKLPDGRLANVIRITINPITKWYFYLYYDFDKDGMIFKGNRLKFKLELVNIIKTLMSIKPDTATVR